MRKKIWERLRGEQGSETVEMVMCMPLLMLMLSYIICFSQIFYANQIALTAADIGARVAITKTSAAVAHTKAQEAAVSYADEAGMGITFFSDDLTYKSWKRGEVLSYSVTLHMDTAMPMPKAGGFDTKQEIRRSAHMMIEKE